MAEPSGVPAELTVLLDGRRAGALARGGAAGPVLRYDDAWRADDSAYPLSLSLPLAAAVHGGAPLSHYLRGLLPDGETRLNVLAHRFQVPPDDPYALLAWVGGDCPGAVQIVRPDAAAALEPADVDDVAWLEPSDLADLIRGLRAENAGAGAPDTTGRFSLPGALAKATLVRDPARGVWGRPLAGRASTHIIKPPLSGAPNHCENEHLSLVLAAAVGIPAAASVLVRAGDEIAIVVARYDRIAAHGRIARLHQEDMAQALGRNPRLRYAAEGAPGIGEIVTLLRDHSERGLDDVLAFLRAVGLNWVLAGTDAHARNYSVLIGRGGSARFAPVYDLASALLLPSQFAEPDLPFPMAVAGRTRLGDIGREAWERQGREIRVDPVRVVQLLADLADSVSAAVEGVARRAAEAGCDREFGLRYAARIRERAEACAAELR